MYGVRIGVCKGAVGDCRGYGRIWVKREEGRRTVQWRARCNGGRGQMRAQWRCAVQRTQMAFGVLGMKHTQAHPSPRVWSDVMVVVCVMAVAGAWEPVGGGGIGAA